MVTARHTRCRVVTTRHTGLPSVRVRIGRLPLAGGGGVPPFPPGGQWGSTDEPHHPNGWLLATPGDPDAHPSTLVADSPVQMREATVALEPLVVYWRAAVTSR